MLESASLVPIIGGNLVQFGLSDSAERGRKLVTSTTI